MTKKRVTEFSELPLVLTVEELTGVLCVGRSTAYELVRAGIIRSVKVGHSYRIPRGSVVEFLMGTKETLSGEDRVGPKNKPQII